MAAVRRFLLRFLSLFRSTRAEHELGREIHAHLQLLEDQFLAKGMSAADARRAAKRAFGGVEQAKEHQRDARSFRWLAGWPMDLKLTAPRRVITTIFSRAFAQIGLGILAGCVPGYLLVALGAPEMARGGGTALAIAATIATAAFIAGVTVLACLVPARRALRIQATVALRTDG